MPRCSGLIGRRLECRLSRLQAIMRIAQFITSGGEEVTIELVIPPASEYAGDIRGFLSWIDAENFRSITSRLAGEFCDVADDRFFFAKIDGEIVGQMWYGWGRHEQPVANFGQVYVATRHRRKGIAERLFSAFCEHFFNDSPPIAAFCSTGSEWVANIYKSGGFRTIDPEAAYGPLYCPKPGLPDTFDDFSERFYSGQFAGSVHAVPATMEYRHEIDCVLKFTKIRRGVPPKSIPSFQQAYFDKLDGKGDLVVLMSPRDRPLGWHFTPYDGSAPLMQRLC